MFVVVPVPNIVYPLVCATRPPSPVLWQALTVQEDERALWALSDDGVVSCIDFGTQERVDRSHETMDTVVMGLSRRHPALAQMTPEACHYARMPSTGWPTKRPSTVRMRPLEEF